MIVSYDPLSACEVLNSTLCVAHGVPQGCTFIDRDQVSCPFGCDRSDLRAFLNALIAMIYINSTLPQTFLTSTLKAQLGTSLHKQQITECHPQIRSICWTRSASLAAPRACGNMLVCRFTCPVKCWTRKAGPVRLIGSRKYDSLIAWCSGLVSLPALPCFNSCKSVEALCAQAFTAIRRDFPSWSASRLHSKT